MTPLMGPDQQIYALAQGQIVVGGYRFDSNFNREQKNYPTSGILPSGATVERPVKANLVGPQNELTFILNAADFTTAERIRDQVNAALGADAASVTSASSVRIATTEDTGNTFRLVSRIEGLTVDPDEPALVVINERTGTVVSGGGVLISSVVVSQGDIRVSVSLDNQAASDPQMYPRQHGAQRRSLIVTNTKLEVNEPSEDAVVQFPNTTVADLVVGLSRVHIGARGMIAVLQAIKAAGALHANIIVQ
jgi:flagellar P-ring protein precursor FlgI